MSTLNTNAPTCYHRAPECLTGEVLCSNMEWEPSQRGNGLKQYFESAVADAMKTFTQRPCHITLHAQRHVHTTFFFLDFHAFTESGSVLPLTSSCLGILDDLLRNTAHGCTVHTETTFGDTFFELVQESNRLRVFINVDAHALVDHFRVRFELLSQRAVVSRKEADTADAGADIMKDGLRDCNTVI